MSNENCLEHIYIYFNLKMFSQKFFSVVTLAFFLGILRVYAGMDEDEMTTAVNDMSQVCGEELGIAPEKVKEFKWDFMDYDPCFLNCFYEREGVMRNGKFDKDAMEFAKMYIKDESVLAQIKKRNEDCSKVNDVDISDGDISCKRAVLLHKCLSDQKII